MRIDSLNFLPQFILNNPDIAELLVSEQNELDRFFNYIELMRNQPVISTASIYLSRYERMFGLTQSSSGLTDAERIGRILAKMNTRTNSTVEAIKTVVSSITGCETEIREQYDFYTFMIDILRNNVQIINIENVKEAIEVIKPAHLAFAIVMCWKWSVGLKVDISIFKVLHDFSSDVGRDYDFAGEIPDTSYLGVLETSKVNVSSKLSTYMFPFSLTGEYPTLSTLGQADQNNIKIDTTILSNIFEYDVSSLEAGILPIISTLGALDDENGQIEAQIETYATPLIFAQENDDYCGEE